MNGQQRDTLNELIDRYDRARGCHDNRLHRVNSEYWDELKARVVTAKINLMNFMEKYTMGDDS